MNKRSSEGLVPPQSFFLVPNTGDTPYLARKRAASKKPSSECIVSATASFCVSSNRSQSALSFSPLRQRSMDATQSALRVGLLSSGSRFSSCFKLSTVNWSSAVWTSGISGLSYSFAIVGVHWIWCAIVSRQVGALQLPHCLAWEVSGMCHQSLCGRPRP